MTLSRGIFCLQHCLHSVPDLLREDLVWCVWTFSFFGLLFVDLERIFRHYIVGDELWPYFSWAARSLGFDSFNFGLGLCDRGGLAFRARLALCFS